MKHAFSLFLVWISAPLCLGNQALAQCFVCSDFSKNTTSGYGTGTGGANNSAFGYQSLYGNGGSNNTAIGFQSLASGPTGTDNTAMGYQALHANTSGENNNASGSSALHNNTTGKNNNAMGDEALLSSTTADNNNAVGHAALFSNTTGAGNSAIGTEALFINTTGSSNNAIGFLALYSNTSGSYNVGIGYEAGYNLTSGSNNIDIANHGMAADSGVIRIGIPGTQTQAFVAGVATAQITGSAVYVTSNGQLGVLASSERYKTAIAPMGANTEKLEQLRPVSFHLKSDPNGAVQYGLIAEEVANVYPELVIRDEAGKIQGVRYDELAPMLLNEVQQLKREMAELKQANRSMQAAMEKLVAKDGQVAMR
jgi:hypothetical protein